jgi:hypothetical protein
MFDDVFSFYGNTSSWLNVALIKEIYYIQQDSRNKTQTQSSRLIYYHLYTQNNNWRVLKFCSSPMAQCVPACLKKSF